MTSHGMPSSARPCLFQKLVGSGGYLLPSRPGCHEYKEFQLPTQENVHAAAAAQETKKHTNNNHNSRNQPTIASVARRRPPWTHHHPCLLVRNEGPVLTLSRWMRTIRYFFIQSMTRMTTIPKEPARRPWRTLLP